MSYYETVDVRVIPRSSRAEVAGMISGRVKIKLTSAPVDDKANEELVDFLSDILNKQKSYIQIIRGAKSRDKTLKILCFEDDELAPLGL